MKALVCAALERAGFVNGFSTRQGGVSPYPENALNLAGFGEDSDENIQENRRRFLRLFPEPSKLTTVWQVHGDGVKIARTDTDIANTEDKFDAVASDKAGLLVGVKTADCVPVLLGDAKSGAYAAVHAGWRGTAQSIIVKAVEKMRAEFGAEPVDLICAIGPAAVSSYEVGQDVLDAFARNFAESAHLFTPTRPGHALVDLHRANREQLLRAGVLLENIHTAPFCTMARLDLFFSYRAENKLHGKTGRLLSVIGRQ